MKKLHFRRPETFPPRHRALGSPLAQHRENSATDTSPLIQIKQALQSIKGDVNSFELRIGVVSHTLMQAKLRSSKVCLPPPRRRRRRRRRRSDKHPLKEAAQIKLTHYLGEIEGMGRGGMREVGYFHVTPN